MPCGLCGKPIDATDELGAFSAFVVNRKDPLAVFSDGVFHAACFRQHPLSEKAQHRWEETRARLGPPNRVCIVCGRPINDPDDYFTLGHLTDDPASPVFEFNFLQAHRSHLSMWRRYGTMKPLVEEYQRSGAWDGPRAEW
jgi:hypothetical protein